MKASAIDEVDGQLEARASLAGGVREHPAGVLDVLVLAQRRADGVALGLQEREAPWRRR